jgi:hypothetical protein
LEDDEEQVMRSAIKVVKRKDREASLRSSTAEGSSVDTRGRRDIDRTVMTWVAESRERRQAEVTLPIQFTGRLAVRQRFELSTQTVKSYLTSLIAVALILLSVHGETRAQTPSPSSDSLTLDEAIAFGIAQQPRN